MDYPDDLHDEHNDYPLAPESLTVTDDLLSPFCMKMRAQLEIGKDTCEKLVPNLMPKKGYVCDIRALKFYKEQGLEVSAVHSVLTFRQCTWMKDFIDFNTSMRAKAKNTFEKDFFKLMSNSTFGKTMENKRNRVSMDFLATNRLNMDGSKTNYGVIARKLSSPLYKGHKIYSRDLAVLKQHQKELVLDKPIYAGMAILDLSKLHMYGYHYGEIKATYGDKAKLLFTDTDSLCYEIETEDLYQDLYHKQCTVL